MKRKVLVLIRYPLIQQKSVVTTAAILFLFVGFFSQALLFERRDACKDGESQCYNKAVFDDVLSLKRRREKCLPGNLRKDDEREHGCR